MSISLLATPYTYIDENLGAVKRKMRGRKMLPTLGRMHAIMVSDSADVKCGTTRVRPTLHRTRTELLEVKLISERNPPYRTGIADKYFKPIELILK